MKNKKISTDAKMPVKQDVLTATTYCYSYHRISTSRQLTGGGIRRQMEASEKISHEKGWTMDTSFNTDIGKSAYSGKNLDDKAALGQQFPLNLIVHFLVEFLEAPHP